MIKHKPNGPIIFDWWLHNKPHRYYGPSTQPFWYLHGVKIKYEPRA